MTKAEYLSYVKNTYSPEDSAKILPYCTENIEESARMLAGREQLGLCVTKEKDSYRLINKIGQELDVFYFQEHRKTEKHSDHLSFTLHVDGEEIIYRSNILVDGKCPPKESKNNKQHYNLVGNYAYMQNTITGYMSYENGVLVKRGVIAIGSRIFVIADEFYAVGVHEYRQTYRFNSAGTVSLDGQRISYEGKHIAMDMFCFGEASTANGGISKMSVGTDNPFEQLEKEDTVLVNVRGTAFTTMMTVLHAYKKDGLEEESEKFEIRKLMTESIFRGGMLVDSEAEAIEIRVGKKRYVVVIGHQDTYGTKDMLRAGDCTGFGNIMVFDADEEGKPLAILK